jgi:beta-glucosidase
LRVASIQSAGAAVPQLYVGLASSPGVIQPPSQLKGFQKVTLAPGHTTRVSFAIDTRALSYWDTQTNHWRVAPGCYAVKVGDSSRSLPLVAALAVDGASCHGARLRLSVPG